MSCPQVQMTSPSLFPSPDPYRHRRCAKLYTLQYIYIYNPGAGHGARVLAGGLRLVTEGYRRCAPCRRPTPGSFRADCVSTEVPVIYGVLRARCSKTLTVFRALRRQGTPSWRCYKTVDLTWFWAPGGGPVRKDLHLQIVPTSCNLRCFARAMFKNIVFYSVSGPSALHLGDVTKPWFLRGFGLQEGARCGKICIFRSFQHRWPKHGPNISPT